MFGRRQGPGWSELLRNLHGSFVRVLRAEIEALSDDLSASSKNFGLALLYWFFAAGLALFALGALAFAAVAGLTRFMPAWAAGLLIAGILVGGAALFTWVGQRRMRLVEGPGTAVRRRMQSHVDWWETTVVTRAAGEPETDAARARAAARAESKAGGEWDTDPDLEGL